MDKQVTSTWLPVYPLLTTCKMGTSMVNGSMHLVYTRVNYTVNMLLSFGRWYRTEMSQFGVATQV